MMIERDQLENKKKRVQVDNMAVEIKYHTAKLKVKRTSQMQTKRQTTITGEIREKRNSPEDSTPDSKVFQEETNNSK